MKDTTVNHRVFFVRSLLVLSARGNKDDPKLLCLMKYKTLSQPEQSVRPAHTEGRKFGFSLILATQTLQSIKDEGQALPIT